jgi:cytochrome c biogenesis protein CcmG, thiol:disulfide interchange protein DsbE
MNYQKQHSPLQFYLVAIVLLFGSVGFTHAADSSRFVQDIPRFGANSPFSGEYKSPLYPGGKQLWAQSRLWQPAPDLVVEDWIGDQPDTQGKYLLIEFWATWCSQCKKSVPLLNRLHQRFGDELAVIGISDEPVDKVSAMHEPAIDYYRATDTQARMKKALAVKGIPHVIIVEPGGAVVWEGFPLLEGYELTEEIVEKILAVGRGE